MTEDCLCAMTNSRQRLERSRSKVTTTIKLTSIIYHQISSSCQTCKYRFFTGCVRNAPTGIWNLKNFPGKTPDPASKVCRCTAEMGDCRRKGRTRRGGEKGKEGERRKRRERVWKRGGRYRKRKRDKQKGRRGLRAATTSLIAWSGSTTLNTVTLNTTTLNTGQLIPTTINPTTINTTTINPTDL